MSEGETVEPRVAIDPSPQMQTFADSDAPQPKPAGPQIWAVVATLWGLYYLYTRVLGKPLPRLGSGGGRRVGATAPSGGGSASVSSSKRRAEMAAAWERQQQRLDNAARTREGDSTVRERPNATANSGNDADKSGQQSKLTIQEHAQLLRQQQLAAQKKAELEAKKKKQRQMYLKQRELEKKSEEERRKDEELGPGWRYRENPNDVRTVGNMDPQAGSGGGGYKAPCKKRSG